MAVGIAVDYAAHIAHSFMANAGSRVERAIQTVEDMSRSLIAGSVSTFIGVLPLCEYRRSKCRQCSQCSRSVRCLSCSDLLFLALTCSDLR
jgi:hypothetical protein